MSATTLEEGTIVVAYVRAYDVTVLGTIMRQVSGGEYQVKEAHALTMRGETGDQHFIHVLYTAAAGDIQPLPPEQQHLNTDLLLDLYGPQLGRGVA